METKLSPEPVDVVSSRPKGVEPELPKVGITGRSAFRNEASLIPAGRPRPGRGEDGGMSSSEGLVESDRKGDEGARDLIGVR